MINQNEPMKIGSYPYRGTVNICRMLCQYLNMPYSNILFNPCTWKTFKEERTKNWHFQQLPFLIDNNIVVTQTYPICEYLIKKSGNLDLLGKDTEDKFIVDSIMWGKDPIQSRICFMVENKNNPQKMQEEMKGNWCKSVRGTLLSYEAGAKADQFYLGYLTVIDFIIHEVIDHFKDMFWSERQHFTKLMAISDRIDKLPQIKAFLNSNRNIKEMCALGFYRNWKLQSMKKNEVKGGICSLFCSKSKN